MRILVADDDPVILKVLSKILAPEGYEVLTARNGQQAWELFNKDPVRIIISDWLMPELDGLELCHKIRNRANTPYTYYMLLTSNVDPEGDDRLYQLAIDSGIDDFLPKPIDPGQIGARLKVAERICDETHKKALEQRYLTMCSYSNRVRTPDDRWISLEDYVKENLNIEFSHGVSPECYETIIRPQLEALKKVTQPPKKEGDN